MQRLTYTCGDHKPCPLLWERPVLTVHVVNLRRFHLCTSLVPRPTIVAFDLGTRLHVRMHTKLENDVLCNGQPSHRALWMAFLTRVNLKTLSGWEAARCDEHQFCAKIKVSTWAVFELSLFDKVVWTKKERKKERKNNKNGTFATAHFFV